MLRERIPKTPNRKVNNVTVDDLDWKKQLPKCFLPDTDVSFKICQNSVNFMKKQSVVLFAHVDPSQYQWQSLGFGRQALPLCNTIKTLQNLGEGLFLVSTVQKKRLYFLCSNHWHLCCTGVLCKVQMHF